MLNSDLGRSRVTDALARDRLGVWQVMFNAGGGVAPLTVAGGVVTTAFAVTGLTAIPAGFVAVAGVLALFSVGYVAMARHITNAGAFYAFVTRGLGRPAGIAAAMVALVAYNLLQTGLYGLLGPSSHDLAAQHLGWSWPWWIWAGFAWALVGILGPFKVDLNAKVLAVLLCAEVAAILALTVTGIAHPAGGHVSFSTLEPWHLFHFAAGAVGLICWLGYLGFELTAVSSEEARNPRHTIPQATYWLLGGVALLYASSGWSMAVRYGEDKLASTAQQQGPGMLFAMGGTLLGLVANCLFITSALAAAIAFHNSVNRYIFVLAREGVLPRGLRRTNAYGSPWVASVAQSLFGFVVIAVYAVNGWDPLVRLFFWLGTTGGFGVMVLLAVTSFAVIGFFARDPAGESAWRRWIAPGAAGLILTGLVYLAATRYDLLLPPGSPGWLRWLPGVYVVAILVGLLWAVGLRFRNPDAYKEIGLTTPQPTHRPSLHYPIAHPAPHWQGVDL